MTITLPPPPVRKLTADEATSISKRGRKLLRRGLLTHREYVLLDTLLWSCRAPTGAIVVSYTRLTSLCCMARETIARGLRTLEGLGLLSRVKRRTRQLWRNGGVSSRQATTAYRLHPAPVTEFGAATVPCGQEILYTFVQAGGHQVGRQGRGGDPGFANAARQLRELGYAP